MQNKIMRIKYKLLMDAMNWLLCLLHQSYAFTSQFPKKFSHEYFYVHAFYRAYFFFRIFSSVEKITIKDKRLINITAMNIIYANMRQCLRISKNFLFVQVILYWIIFFPLKYEEKYVIWIWTLHKLCHIMLLAFWDIFFLAFSQMDWFNFYLT